MYNVDVLHHILETDKMFPDLGKWVLHRALTDARELWKLLKTKNVHTLQGYFFSRPVILGQFLEWCRSRS